MKITAKRIGYVSIQLSHHVPCQDGETFRIRTGYEKVIAHQSGEVFAGVAREDGVVEDVDEDLKLIRVRYAYQPPKPQGDLALNLTRMQVDAKMDANEGVFITIPDTAARTVPVGGYVTISGRGLFQVAEVLPFASTQDLPAGWDTALTAIQIKQLASAKSVLYVRLQPVIDKPADRIDIFRYGDQYTSISGSYMTQTLVPTVKAGDAIKQGDVLCYNSGFFERDPDGRQVSWKHGVVGTVVFMDRSETYEDSCEISQPFADKLATSPGHARILELTNNTAIHSMVSIGETVETTDYLAIIEDGDLDALTSVDDPDTFDMLTSLNRKMPRAKYHGRIVEIRLYHACEYVDLHPSIQKLARQLAKRKIAYHQAYEKTSKAGTVPLPQKVPLGTKYMGVDFSDITQVAIVIIIADELSMGVGDKVVLVSSAKSTVAAISEKTTLTESGREVDMFFSASGIANRMLTSPVNSGIGQAVLEKLELDVVDLYFNDKG